MNARLPSLVFPVLWWTKVLWPLYIQKDFSEWLAVSAHRRCLRVFFHATFSRLSLDRPVESRPSRYRLLLLWTSPEAKVCLSFSVGFCTVWLDSVIPGYSDDCSDNCSHYSDNLKKKKKKGNFCLLSFLLLKGLRTYSEKNGSDLRRHLMRQILTQFSEKETNNNNNGTPRSYSKENNLQETIQFRSKTFLPLY